MSRPAIQHAILDRDGVLNREAQSGWLSSPTQWKWEDGSREALRLLARAGVKISVVSNQSGVGRGVVSQEAVDGLHRWLQMELASDGVELVGVFVCPHSPEDGCDCRKPLPGLVHQAIDRSGVAATSSILIGDDKRDLDAGRAAGVRVALVRTGKGGQIEEQLEPNALVFENLLDAARSMVREMTGAPSATQNR